MDGVSWDVYGDIPPAKHYVSFEFFRLQDFCILFFYMSTNISNRLFLIKEMVKSKIMVSPSFTENNELYTSSGRAHSIIKLFFFIVL